MNRAVAGIEADPAAPGYKHIIFQPHTGGGLTFVKAFYESVYGRVGSSWEEKDKTVCLRLEIPVNTTATVILEEGAVPREGQKIEFITENGNIKAELGSGSYQIFYNKR